MKISFYKHNLGEDEKQAVADVMDTEFLSTGPKCAEFEKDFAEYLNQRYCVTLSSCTNGLFLLLKYFKLKEDEKVIVPSMTFIATANVVTHCGGTPVFVDVDKKTGLLDIDLVEKAIQENPEVVGILPVHLYGNMIDVKKLMLLKEKYNLRFVIEDSAHCVEGMRDGYRPGMMSDAAAFSFYATKNLACGEGGAVVTNNPDISEYLMRMRLHGMSKSALSRMQKYEHYDVDAPGYKCNLTDIQAAILVTQLKKLEGYLTRRVEIADIYNNGLDFSRIEKFYNDSSSTKNALHLYTIMLNNRDEYIKYMRENEVNIVVNYRGVHEMSCYKNVYGDKDKELPNTKYISDRVVTLPFYSKLTDEEVTRIIELTNKFVYSNYQSLAW